MKSKSKNKNKQLPNHTSIVGQKTKELDPMIEISVLTDMLKRLETEENYELAAIVFRRISRLKKPETEDRS